MNRGTIFTVAFLSLLAVSSCFNQPELEADISPPRDSVDLRVHYYHDTDAVTDAYAKHHKLKGDVPVREGWAIWSPDDSRCDIHVVEPKHQNDVNSFHTIGHELVHCTHGAWHK